MPSYSNVIQLDRSKDDAGPNDFYKEQHFFRDGKVMLFKRADHKRPKWQARYRIDGRYKTVSLKTYDYEQAKTKALEEFDKMRFMLEFDMPVFKRTVECVIDEFVAVQLKRVENGEISKHWGSTGRSIYKAWKTYLGEYDVTKIPQKKIDDYANWRRNNNKNGVEIKIETIAMELSYFRSCMIWAKERKYVGEFQAPNIKVPFIKSYNRSKRYSFSRKEMERLDRYIGKWERDKSISEKERAYRVELATYIRFLFYTGIRPGSETLTLRWKDIEPKDKSLRIWVTGKRGTKELVAQPEVMWLINEWRQSQKIYGDEQIIFNRIHDRSGISNKTKKNVVAIFEGAGVRIGPNNSKRSLYCLRHTYITFALQDGLVRIEDLADNTRTSVPMIMSYYRDITTDDFAERIVQRKPRKL